MFKDCGLLILRLSVGLMMAVGHGWPKLMAFGERAHVFPDPFGISGPASLALVVFAEVFCSIAVALGLFTRFAAFPPFFTMIVAIGFIHAHDPWEKKEFALLYAIPFLVLMLTGAGAFSVDVLIRRKRD